MGSKFTKADGSEGISHGSSGFTNLGKPGARKGPAPAPTVPAGSQSPYQALAPNHPVFGNRSLTQLDTPARIRIAQAPATPAVLDELLTDPSGKVRRLAVANPNLTAPQLDRVVTDQLSSDLAIIEARKDLTTQQLQTILDRGRLDNIVAAGPGASENYWYDQVRTQRNIDENQVAQLDRMLPWPATTS
jgi:hypothetical protein